MPSPAVKRRRIHGPESSAANRNKSLTELEVYDDFEGAHTPRSSGKKTLSGRWAKNGMDDGRQGRLAAGTNTSSWAGRRNLDNDAHAGDVQHEEAVRRHRSRRSLRKSERLAMIQQQNGSFRQERDRAQRKDEGQNARADTGELEHARSNLRGHAPTPTKAKSKSSRLQRLRQLSSTATPATASHDNPTPMRAGRLNGSAREDSNRAKRASPLSDFDATSGVEDLSDFKPVTPSVRRRASARRQARNEGLNGIDTMNVDSGSILANEEDEEDGEEFYDAVTSPLDPSDQLHSEADAAAAHLGDVEMSGTLDTPKKSKRDMKGSPAAHGTSSRADRLEMATKAAMTDLHETTMDSPKRRGRPPKPGATSTASAEVNETEMQVRQSTVASPGLRDGRNGTGQQRKESLTAQTNGEISSHHADEMDLDQDELDHGIDEAPERKTPFYTPRTRSARRETGSAIPSGAVDGKNFGTTPLGNGITLTSDHAASVSVEKGALELIHHIALSKLTGRRPIPLQPPLTPGPYDMLHSVLLNTILSGEGNSLMVIGPSGSGKSALVDAALRDVAQNPEVLAAAASTDFGLGENHVKGSAKKKRGKATRPDSQHQTAFHVVRLDGLIHTDDKIAVHDIWRQLGREVELQQLQQELEADVTHEGDAAALDVNFRTPHSHADTLAMLLALLSHPDEHERALGRHIDPGAPRRVAQAVIFVLSSFERFATHGRQKLLYNLLDVAQSRKAPVCVVGLTTRVDVSDMMEKRVKSRFGHRYIHCSLPKSLGGFADVCKAAMRVEKHELSVSERELLVEGNENDRRERIAKVHFAGARKGVGGVRSGVDWLGTWNGAVEALFTERHFIESYIRPEYHLTKCARAVLTSLIVPLSTLPLPAATQPNPSSPSGPTSRSPRRHPALDSSSPAAPHALSLIEHFLAYALNDDAATDSSASAAGDPGANAAPLAPLTSTPVSTLSLLLPSLSTLQLALLIAAARLDIIHGTPSTTFGLVYDEYVGLAGAARRAAAGSMRVWGREVARAEWEGLLALELVVPVAEGAAGAAGGSGGVGSAAVGAMVRVDVALEEIPGAVGERLGRVMERWCKQI